MKKLLVILFVICLFACDARDDRHIVEDGISKIMLVSDLHYLSSDLYDNGEKFNAYMATSDAKLTKYSDVLVDGIIDTALEENADVLIISGDLTFNGEKLSHEQLSKRLAYLQDRGVDVLVIPGNHDINNMFAYKFEKDNIYYTDNVNEEDFKTIYASLGYQNALYYDDNSYSYVYELDDEHWLLFVDVNSYSQNRVLTSTLDWVKEVLEKAKADDIKVIGITHQNVLGHSDQFGFDYIIQNGYALNNLYKEYGVKLNLSGHMHIQHYTNNKYVYDVATNAISVYPNLYAIITFDNGYINYNTYGLEISDFNYEGYDDFRAYSRDYFDQVTYRSFDKRYNIFEDEDELDMALDFYYELNRSFFGGDIIDNYDKLIGSDGYKLFEKYQLTNARLDDMLNVKYNYQHLILEE